MQPRCVHTPQRQTKNNTLKTHIKKISKHVIDIRYGMFEITNCDEPLGAGSSLRISLRIAHGTNLHNYRNVVIKKKNYFFCRLIWLTVNACVLCVVRCRRRLWPTESFRQCDGERTQAYFSI